MTSRTTTRAPAAHRAAAVGGRRDLERQLHDGAALRISALTLRLGLLRHRRPDDEQEFQAAVDELQDELHQVLQELRDVAGRLYPPLLDEAGLGPALREAAGRARGAGADRGARRAVRPGRRGRRLLRGARLPARRSPCAPVEVVVRRDGDDVVVLVSGVDACHDCRLRRRPAAGRHRRGRSRVRSGTATVDRL